MKERMRGTRTDALVAPGPGSRWSAPARGSRAASSSNDPTKQEVINKPRDQCVMRPVHGSHWAASPMGSGSWVETRWASGSRGRLCED